MGRQTKRSTSIIVLGVVAALVAAGLFPCLAWADPAAPTDFQIESAQVCRHVVEDDDFILVFHYNIHYSSGQPDEPANEIFTFRLLDTDGIGHLAAIIPYAYYNSGYDQGCAAFYFSADDAPTWEQSYIVRMSGNPEYFASPPVTSHTLITSEYSQLDTQEENQTLLGNYILEVARDLETNWSAELLYTGDMGTVLNSTGEAYFRGAIGGLAAMAPQIFPIQITTPEYTETEWTEAQGEEYTTRFEDTWIGESLLTLGNFLHIQWNVITGIMVVGVIIALAVISQWRYGNVKPVSSAGSCVILGGAVLGWVAPAIVAIITVLFALFLGYIWIFRHG